MSSSWIGEADKEMNEKRLRERAEWEQALYEARIKLDELVASGDYRDLRVDVEYPAKGTELRVACDGEEVGRVTWSAGEYAIHSSYTGNLKGTAKTKDGAQPLILGLVDDLIERHREKETIHARQSAMTSRRLHYWGDLDTHGFAMLDRLREAFPDAQSLLMDRNTLVANKALWGIEDAPHIAPLTRLTTAEAAVFDDLRFDRLGRGVRLEQERIPFGSVIEAVAAAADDPRA